MKIKGLILEIIVGLLFLSFFYFIVREAHGSPSFYLQYNGKLELKKRDYAFLDLWNYKAEEFEAVKKNGSKLFCYFSSQYENFRPDYKLFDKKDLGNKLGSWSGERWVNTRSAKVREIMTNRILMAKAKGCEGIDLDNTDFYDAKTGFKLTKKDAIDYITYLAGFAKSNGLEFSLKNSLAIIKDLKDIPDVYQNESCTKYSECSYYKGVGKPVFGLTYKSCKKYPEIFIIQKKQQAMDAWDKVCL